MRADRTVSDAWLGAKSEQLAYDALNQLQDLLGMPDWFPASRRDINTAIRAAIKRKRA